MKRFELQGVELPVPAKDAFRYIAGPARLPEWTDAFTEVDDGRAVMRTPEGRVEVDLRVEADPDRGTVDWSMGFPDGSVATAFSRLVDLGGGRCAYTFVLTPPPVPLEALEGALEAQAHILREELSRLGAILAGSHG